MSAPAFIYGTAWKEERTRALTTQALEVGFRAIDTANQRRHYFEAQVGEAIDAAITSGLLTREQLFLQSKFTYRRGQDHRLPYDPDAPPAEQVAQSLASSLEHLRTTFLDSLLLHGPSQPVGIDENDRAVWRAMGELQAAGKVRLVGVSNVSREQLERLLALSPRPAFVQNRCYAKMGWDAAVRELCRAEGVAYQGFSLLTANQRELAAPVVARIAERTSATVPQVVFAFARAVGMIPLTGSSDAQHLRQDLGADQIALDEADLDAILHLALR